MQKLYWKFWWAFIWRTFAILIPIAWLLYFIMLRGAGGNVQEAVSGAVSVSYVIGPFVQVYIIKRLFTKHYSGFVATISENNSDE